MQKNTWAERTRVHGGTCAHLRNVPEGLEIVSVGSGPGLSGISFDRCPRRGYNLCTAPQSLAYGFRLLKHFADRFASGASVVIVVMPFSFGENAAARATDYSDRFYGILPPGEIEGYTVRRAHMLQRLRRVQLRRAGRLLPAAPPCGDPPLIAGWKQQFSLKNLKDPAQAEAHRPAFARKAALLSDELAFCEARGLRPVLVLPPVPPKTRAYFGSEFLEAFLYGPLAEACSRHPKTPVLDYFADERFGDGEFRQGIFLGGEGREKFSEILFRDLGL